jgi:hypothetical protein
MFIAPGIFISVLLIAGPLNYAAGWVGIWIEACRNSIIWGLLVVLIPPVTVVFALFHWETARFPTVCLLLESASWLWAISYALYWASQSRTFERRHSHDSAQDQVPLTASCRCLFLA